MATPKQLDVPTWTAQVCCISPFLALLALIVANACGRSVDSPIVAAFALVCVKTTGWVLRVPAAKILESGIAKGGLMLTRVERHEK